MSMKESVQEEPPSGEDDGWIEDEIQRELDALDVNNLEEDDDEENIISDDDVIDEDVPDTVSNYLLRVQSRTEGFTKELEECDQILQDTSVLEKNEDFYYKSKELNELAFILGEDPEELRDRVISELENEDAVDVKITKQGEGDANLQQQKDYDITEENGKIAVIVEADILEQAAQKQIIELEEKHRARSMVAAKERELHLQTEARREQELYNTRQRVMKENAKKEQEMIQARNVEQEKIKQELHEESKKMEASLQQYKEEIQDFTKKMEEEKKVFDEELLLRKAQKEKMEKKAAILIQSVFRSYRTRKPYLKRMHKMLEELKEKREQDRQCEILTERRKEEQKKKKEIMEKKRKQEEERKQKEEQLKKEEEERKEAERKRIEKEKKERLEKERIEQERLESERLKMEEEEKARLELEKREKEILAKIKAENEKSKEEAKEKQKEQINSFNKHEESSEIKDEECSNECNRDREEKDSSKMKLDVVEAVTLTKKNIDKEFSQKVPTSDISPESLNKLPIKTLETSFKDIMVANCKELSPIDNIEEKPTVVQSSNSSSSKDTSEGLSKKAEETFSNVNSLVENNNDEIPSNDLSHLSGATNGLENVTSVKGLPELNLLSPLPEALEAKRLQWIQTCVPFSKIQSQLKGSNQKIVQRQKRRPASAKKLQPLTKEQILASSSLQTSLAEVTTVRLSDLPGCTLTSLDQCSYLVAMEIHNCNLVALEGVENLKNVRYIDVTNNKIEFINCKEKNDLCSLHLSHNNLSTVHGLDGCTGLRRLTVSYNKITKVGCIASFSNLQVLDMSHNQLMTMQGLGSLALLQQVDLSNNHLSSIEGLENCCLVTQLNLASNNLSQIPSLKNQVLLQKLNVCNNSISQLDPLFDCWLPCLRDLNISENSLEEVPPSLTGLPYLSLLDVRHNYISEVTKLSGLELFKKLQNLLIDGNPVKEEKSFKCHVLSLLPRLKNLDSEKIECDTLPEHSVTEFEESCESQIRFQENLHVKWNREFKLLKDQGDLEGLPKLEQTYLKKMEGVMKDHRYMHEYGDTTIIKVVPANDDVQVDPRLSKSRPDEGTDCVNVGPIVGEVASTGQVDLTGQVAANHTVNAVVSTTSGGSDKTTGNRRGSSDLRTGVITTKAFVEQTKGKRQTDRAATIIQAQWRGHCIRRDIRKHAERWLAAVTIQTFWRGDMASNRVREIRKCVQQDRNKYNAMHVAAVTMIQAWWHGIRTRRCLRNARQKSVVEFEDEDELYPEIDLSTFDYVESDWRPTDEPQLPQAHPTLPPSTSQHLPSPPTQERPPSRTIRHAWRNINSPQQNNKASPDVLIVEEDSNMSTYSETSRDKNTLAGKPPLPPLSGLSGTLKTSRSEKEEQISEEWGFKDESTAALMMKRARKMKGKKKVDDPMQRLKMIKKLQDTSRKQPIQLAKKGVQRKDYFQGRAEEAAYQEQAPQKEFEEKNQRTFEWLHSQVNNPSDSRLKSKSMMGRHATSEPSLPRMSPDVLQGRVQLIASPSMDLQSVDSKSTVSASSLRHRSHSFSSPDATNIQLLTLKTKSAPTNHTRQRLEAKAKNRGYYKN
ncbi:leucine-rich repeat- and IQ domain-containing protein 1-like [Antedon mediterranea]|uniref:leucine-rich repeat- and IQ domain-containing protein 1-like n=1 Tax=Antedon mediterranea TaxID=105859 RepID=UPI003AF49E53